MSETFGKGMKADRLNNQNAVWLRGLLGLFLAFLLLFSSSFQSDAASLGKLQWLGAKQVSSFQDQLYARPVADVEVREDLQDGTGQFVLVDKATLKHPDPVFLKLARIWLELSIDGSPSNVKPFGRGPPTLVKA